MQKITINNKTYELPTKWAEITLGKYIKLATIIGKFEGADIDEDMFNTVVIPQLMIGLFDLNYKEVNNLTVAQYTQIRQALNFINEPLPKFMPKAKTISNGYEIKITDLQELKFGVWADINHLLATDPIKNIPMAIAKLVTISKTTKWFKKPFKKNKPIEDDNQILEVLNNQPVAEIFSINNFFLLTMMVLKQSILSSSIPAEMKVQAMKQFSQLDGLTTSG